MPVEIADRERHAGGVAVRHLAPRQLRVELQVVAGMALALEGDGLEPLPARLGDVAVGAHHDLLAGGRQEAGRHEMGRVREDEARFVLRRRRGFERLAREGRLRRVGDDGRAELRMPGGKAGDALDARFGRGLVERLHGNRRTATATG